MALYETKKIRVRFSRKVHPRKFNPIEVDMEETAIVRPENANKARRKIYAKLKQDVDHACERILEEEAPKKSKKQRYEDD